MMMIELRENRNRFRWRMVPSLINVATYGLLLMISAARCHAQSAPAQSSLALRPQSASWASGLYVNLDQEDAYRLPATSVLKNANLQDSSSHKNRMASRALTKVAQEIQKMQRRNIEDPFDHYRYDIEKALNNYSRLEGSANSIGVDREAFRQGLVITTATMATAFGALYIFKPIALSNELPNTKLRLGYNVSHLDDPKLALTYDNRYRVGLTSGGFGGYFEDKAGRLYSADLNLLKLRAILKLNF